MCNVIIRHITNCHDLYCNSILLSTSSLLGGIQSSAIRLNCPMYFKYESTDKQLQLKPIAGDSSVKNTHFIRCLISLFFHDH